MIKSFKHEGKTNCQRLNQLQQELNQEHNHMHQKIYTKNEKSIIGETHVKKNSIRFIIANFVLLPTRKT
jgi:hypothetical protein